MEAIRCGLKTFRMLVVVAEVKANVFYVISYDYPASVMRFLRNVHFRAKDAIVANGRVVTVEAKAGCHRVRAFPYDDRDGAVDGIKSN